MLALLAMAALLAGAWRGYRWWTEWPMRLVIRSAGFARPLAFSPDGRLFATSGRDDGTVAIWDAETGAARAAWSAGMKWVVEKGAFSPDGKTFAAACSDYRSPATIALIDPETGDERARLPAPTTWVHDLEFVEGGRKLRAIQATASGHLTEVMTWDLATGDLPSVRDLGCPAVAGGKAVSPDGLTAALAPYGQMDVVLWDIAGGRELGRLSNPNAGATLAHGLAFAPDGRTLIVGREDGSFEVWDVAPRRLKLAFRGHANGSASHAIRISPDGRTLASAGLPSPAQSALHWAVYLGATVMRDLKSFGMEVVVMEIETGRRLARASAAAYPIYSPDGRAMATMGTDFYAQLRASPLPGSPGGATGDEDGPRSR